MKLALSVQKHQEIAQVVAIGNAIGNAQLIAGMYQDSKKFWNAAIDANSGAHLIEGIISITDAKSSAIADYSLQLVNLFVSSKFPTLSLFSKRAFILNPEHRKGVVYRLGSKRFNNNEELFKEIVIDLLCFDPFVVLLAFEYNQTKRAELLTKFIASAWGDYLSEDDWTATHQDLADQLAVIDLDEDREELVNACLELSLEGNAYGDIYQLIGSGLERRNSAE